MLSPVVARRMRRAAFQSLDKPLVLDLAGFPARPDSRPLKTVASDLVAPDPSEIRESITKMIHGLNARPFVVLTWLSAGNLQIDLRTY